MLPRLWLLVVSKGLTDRQTMSLIELSWIAKNRIWIPTSLLLFCMLTACIEGLHGQGGQNFCDIKENFLFCSFCLGLPCQPNLLMKKKTGGGKVTNTKMSTARYWYDYKLSFNIKVLIENYCSKCVNDTILKTDSWRRSRRIRSLVDQPEGKGGRIFCQNEHRTYVQNLKRHKSKTDLIKGKY